MNFIITYLSAAQMHGIFLYYHHLSPHLRAYNQPTQGPAPSWPNSSNGRALHRHYRGQGLNIPEKFRPFSLKCDD